MPNITFQAFLSVTRVTATFFKIGMIGNAILSASGFAKYRRFIIGCNHLEKVSFVSATVEARSSFGLFYKLELARLYLQSVDILLFVHRSCVEKELMRRDGE